MVSRQNRLGHHPPRAPPSYPQLELPVALLEKSLESDRRVLPASRRCFRLGQSQQRRLRGLVVGRHVYDNASIIAEEGRGEEQRVRDMLFCCPRGRRHGASGDDDARRWPLDGSHVEHVEWFDVSVWDRVEGLFRAPPSAVGSLSHHTVYTPYTVLVGTMR